MANERYDFKNIYQRVKHLENEILKRIIPFKTYKTNIQAKTWITKSVKEYENIQQSFPNTFPKNLRNDEFASSYLVSKDTQCEGWRANYSIDNFIAASGIFSSQKHFNANSINEETLKLCEFIEKEKISLIIPVGFGRVSKYRAETDYYDFYHYWHSSQFKTKSNIKFAQIFAENGAPLFFDSAAAENFENLYQEIRFLPSDQKVMVHCLGGIGRTGTFLFLYSERAKLEDSVYRTDYENFFFTNESYTKSEIIDQLLKEGVAPGHPKWTSTKADYRIIKTTLDSISKLRTSRPAIEELDQFSNALLMNISSYFLEIQDMNALQQWSDYLKSLTDEKNPSNVTDIVFFEFAPDHLPRMTAASLKFDIIKFSLLLDFMPIMKLSSPKNHNEEEKTFNQIIIDIIENLYDALPNILDEDEINLKSFDIPQVMSILKKLQDTLNFSTKSFQSKEHYLLSYLKHCVERFHLRLSLFSRYQDNNNTTQCKFFSSPSQISMPCLIVNCEKRIIDIIKKNGLTSKQEIENCTIDILNIIDFYFSMHANAKNSNTENFYHRYDFSIGDYHSLDENRGSLLSFYPSSINATHFDYYHSLSSVHNKIYSMDNNNMVMNLSIIKDIVQNAHLNLKNYQKEQNPWDGLFINKITRLCDLFNSMMMTNLEIISKAQTNIQVTM